MKFSFPFLDSLWPTNQWVLLLCLIFGAYLLQLVMKTVLNFTAARFLQKYQLMCHEKYRRGLAAPCALSIFFIAIYAGQSWALDSQKLIQITSRLCQIGSTAGLVWLAMNLVDILSLYFEQKAQETQTKFDDVLIPLLKSFSKVIVFSVGIIFIGHSLTVNVGSIITGLGIGGIALALAAKDALSNLFGSLAIILDRPFEIGDWVNLNNGIEGTVTKVGFRSTRIKTFHDSELVVPNSQLGNMHVDNYGRRQYRRFSSTLGIQYDTPPEKIEAFCEGIRELILERPHTRKDYFHVYLNKMSDSSLNILLYVFWEVNDWSQELTERHRLLIDILRLAKNIEVEFAFPTQTLHLFNENPRENKNIESNFHETGQKLAQDIAQKRISPLSPRSSFNDAQKPPLE